MIRELLKSFRLSILLAIVAVFASCTKTEYVEVPANPDAPEEKAPTYTIMFYGTGGGNLDSFFLYNMDQMVATGKQERVNFRGLFKFSNELQKDSKYEGTRLLTLTENEGMKSEKKFESTYRMDNPAHLADFIKETKEQMPADKYILIFWNHGSVFTAYDKLVQDDYPEIAPDPKNPSQSRAMLSDDNIKGVPLMSIFEMEKGIKDSGLNPDLVYLDLCNMGMVENYAQIKDLTHYVMGAFQPTPGSGGDYAQLLLSLQQTNSLEDAIKDYLPRCVSKWKEENPQGFSDLECYDMKYMDEFLNHTKKALDRYREVIDKEGTDKSKADSLHYIEQLDSGEGGYAFYTHSNLADPVSADLCTTLRNFQSLKWDGILSAYVTQMNDCLDKMTVAESCFGQRIGMNRVSMGINWPSKSQTININDTTNFAECYRHTTFDNKTKWFDYLSRYAGKYVNVYKSMFFKRENTLCKVSRDRMYYIPIADTNQFASDGFFFNVEWFFDDSDLTDDNRVEAASFIKRINDAYEKLSDFVPLCYIDYLKPELMEVAKGYSPISLFNKYAPKIHVKISIDETCIEHYNKDPDRDKYPAEQTLTFNYVDLHAK